MEAGLALKGRGIVITRPAHQAGPVSQRLELLGATVLQFPLLGIAEPQNITRSQQQLADLAHYDTLLFTSPNAVESALQKLGASIPESATIACIGQKTAQSLERFGVQVSIVPDAVFNSEALLAEPEFQQMQGKRVAIIRGEGGRDLLKSTLSLRGASVDYIDVYRRICPAHDLLPLLKFQQGGQLDIIALTSAESLRNLFTLAGGAAWLDGVALLLGSERMQLALKETTHHGPVHLAADPSDDSMYQALLDWSRHL